MSSADKLRHSLEPVSRSEAEKLSCPVCFTFLCNPIHQCENGHLICNQCISKLRNCPVCRVALPEKKIRSIIAEDYAAKVPFKCRWCKGTYARSEMSDHMADCDYRLIRVCHSLGFPECVQEVPVKDICSHLKIAHKLQIFNIQDGQYVDMPYPGRVVKDAEREGWRCRPNILLSENYPPLLLEFKGSMSTETLSFNISALHSHDKVKNLEAKIKFVFDLEQINSVTWKGVIGKFSTVYSNREDFYVPLCQIQGFKKMQTLVKISS